MDVGNNPSFMNTKDYKKNAPGKKYYTIRCYTTA
jgi:hypothetical protein